VPYVFHAQTVENDQSMMNYFKGMYYSFSAVGGRTDRWY
jgi:hypothetical protein